MHRGIAGVGGFCAVWLLAAFTALASPSPDQPVFPELTGRVVDQADVLRSSTEQAIAEQLRAHEAETTNQVVVVTLRSLQGQTIEDFGHELGLHWRIGQAGRDNGVLLIVAPNEREVRIEVGRGLEGTLTDRLAGTIIDSEIRRCCRPSAAAISRAACGPEPMASWRRLRGPTRPRACRHYPASCWNICIIS